MYNDIRISKLIAPSFFEGTVKQIKGFNNKYFITSKGKVYSIQKDGNIKEKRPFKSHNGYLRVSLCDNGKQKHYFIHRLVAEYFVKNRNNYDSVDHIDQNKLNNDYTNLRWTSKSYNMGRSNAKLNKTKVDYIKKNYKRGNGKELSEKLNVDLSMVVKIAKGKAYNWIDER